MKVALLEFATKRLIGLVDDDGAALIHEEFGEQGLRQPDNGAGTETVQPGGALIRLDWPATVEFISWFQTNPVDPTGVQQFVARRVPVLIGVDSCPYDLAPAEGGKPYDVADSTTAIIGPDGVEPAGERLQSAQPLVQEYLRILDTIGVKPKRGGSGRQKVPRET